MQFPIKPAAALLAAMLTAPAAFAGGANQYVTIGVINNTNQAWSVEFENRKPDGASFIHSGDHGRLTTELGPEVGRFYFNAHLFAVEEKSPGYIEMYLQSAGGSDVVAVTFPVICKNPGDNAVVSDTDPAGPSPWAPIYGQGCDSGEADAPEDVNWLITGANVQWVSGADPVGGVNVLAPSGDNMGRYSKVTLSGNESDAPLIQVQIGGGGGS